MITVVDRKDLRVISDEELPAPQGMFRSVMSVMAEPGQPTHLFVGDFSTLDAAKAREPETLRPGEMFRVSDDKGAAIYQHGSIPNPPAIRL